MSEPTHIGEILPGIMKELDELRARLTGKISQVKALEDGVDAVCSENQKLREENTRLRFMEGYRRLNIPDMPLTLEDIRKRLSTKEFGLILEHAVCLACLQGNAFAGCFEQYLVEAYVNLWSNGAVGYPHEIQNLYPMTAAEYYKNKGSSNHER